MITIMISGCRVLAQTVASCPFRSSRVFRARGDVPWFCQVGICQHRVWKTGLFKVTQRLCMVTSLMMIMIIDRPVQGGPPCCIIQHDIVYDLLQYVINCYTIMNNHSTPSWSGGERAKSFMAVLI